MKRARRRRCRHAACGRRRCSGGCLSGSCPGCARHRAGTDADRRPKQHGDGASAIQNGLVCGTPGSARKAMPAKSTPAAITTPRSVSPAIRRLGDRGHRSGTSISGSRGLELPAPSESSRISGNSEPCTAGMMSSGTSRMRGRLFIGSASSSRGGRRHQRRLQQADGGRRSDLFALEQRPARKARRLGGAAAGRRQPVRAPLARCNSDRARNPRRRRGGVPDRANSSPVSSGRLHAQGGAQLPPRAPSGTPSPLPLAGAMAAAAAPIIRPGIAQWTAAFRRR